MSWTLRWPQCITDVLKSASQSNEYCVMKLKSVKFQIGDAKFNAMSFVSRQVTGMIRQDIWNQLKKQFISEVSISIRIHMNEA
jgi:hypothetical protein